MIYPTCPPSHVDVSHLFVNLLILMTFASHFTIYCHILPYIAIYCHILPYIAIYCHIYICIMCGPFFCCNPHVLHIITFLQKPVAASAASQPRRARPKPSKPQPEPSLWECRSGQWPICWCPKHQNPLVNFGKP